MPNALTALQLEKENSITVCNNSVNYDVCPPSKFRSSTGECNNISHRKWGARGDVFLRLLKSNYADDISQPRSSRGTHALPETESLIDSIQSHLESGARHPHITAMLPAWGQLLSHDLVEFTQMPSDIRCCRQTRNIKNPEEIRQCYVRLGADCKEYQRTAPGYDPESCSKSKFLFSICIA